MPSPSITPRAFQTSLQPSYSDQNRHSGISRGPSQPTSNRESYASDYGVGATSWNLASNPAETNRYSIASSIGSEDTYYGYPSNRTTSNRILYGGDSAIYYRNDSVYEPSTVSMSGKRCVSPSLTVCIQSNFVHG